jgi:hypothetical protein
MAITIAPKVDSGDLTVGLSSSSYAPEYVIQGTTDEDQAVSAMSAAVPASITTSTGFFLVLKTCSVKWNAPSCWIGTANYAPPEAIQKQPGQQVFSFDMTGGTQHITQALTTIGTYVPSGATAPDFAGSIGVTKDAIEGVDITVPVYQFSLTHVFDPADVTTDYMNILFNLTGKVNNGAFFGLAAGECLFLGPSGGKRGDGNWEITFKFAGSPNKTSLVVGGITVPAKKGWEYLWVRYEDTEDAGAKMLIKKPLAATVVQVYDSGDFSTLGIGTS